MEHTITQRTRSDSDAARVAVWLTAHDAPPRVEGAWQEDAACAGTDIELWYSNSKTNQHAALRVCDACPVRAQCLWDAIRQEPIRDMTHGIRGGMTANGRWAWRMAQAVALGFLPTWCVSCRRPIRRPVVGGALTTARRCAACAARAARRDAQ